MRLLADENVPLASVRALRSAGHDTASIAEEAPGSPDRAVLERAVAEDRILLTFDRDFGDLVYRRGASVPPGVILLRFIPLFPEEPAQLVLELSERSELVFRGQFTVVDRERIRQRSLPKTRGGA